jgi:hypothetical protein
VRVNEGSMESSCCEEHGGGSGAYEAPSPEDEDDMVRRRCGYAVSLMLVSCPCLTNDVPLFMLFLSSAGGVWAACQ